MTTKKIVFIVMCAMLAIMIVVSGIVIGKAGALVQGILNPVTPTEDGTTASDTVENTIGDTIASDTQEETEASDTTDATIGFDHVHAYEENSSTPAGCNEEGQTVYKCSCGDTTIETTPALGHSYGPGQVINSCEEGSWTEYKCSRCGYIDKRNVTAPTGHNLTVSEQFPATCDAQASTIYKCTNSNCSYTETEFTGAPLGHSFTKKLETVQVTCTTDGYTMYGCANDGCTAEPKKQDIVSAEGHKFIKWVESGKGMKTVCEKSTCNVTIHSSELAVTDEWCSEDGSYYVIEVGTKDIRRLYTYDIEDNRSSSERKKNPLDYSKIDLKKGLIVAYKDASGTPQEVALGFTNYKLTIEAAPPSGTVDPSTPPATEPSQPATEDNGYVPDENELPSLP